MRHYCTLFDSRYAEKGLALHWSLMRHSSEPFTLHILAMSHDCFYLLDALKLPNVTVIPLGSFEYALKLHPVKESRSWTEYCWTCASSLMQYLIGSVDDLTYLDADTFLFADPKVIFDEIGDKSIGITPHRFPPKKKYMERNGVYNVGLVYAKNNDVGRECISRWATECRAWCFARNEGDKFGDQKFLDSWESDYPGEVCSIQNIGVNLAPWNVTQWQVAEGPTVDGVTVVLYHLHEFAELDATDSEGPKVLFRTSNYNTSPETFTFIYAPYIKQYESAKARIAETSQRLSEAIKKLEMESERA